MMAQNRLDKVARICVKQQHVENFQPCIDDETDEDGRENLSSNELGKEQEYDSQNW